MRGFSFPSDNIASRGLFGMLPKQRVEPEIAERIEILPAPSATGTAAPLSALLGSVIRSHADG